MATITEVTRAQFELRVDDQATAGFKAATEAVEQYNAATAQATETVTKGGPSANALLARLDQQAKAARALAAETKLLQQTQAAQAADAATGGARQAEFARALETATARVTTAQTKLNDLRSASQSAASAASAASPALGSLGSSAAGLGNSAGVTASQMRQLSPQLNDLFTTIASGGGVMQALIQQGGQITPIFGGIKGTFAAIATALGPVGIGAIAVGGAFTAMALATEIGDRRLAALQQSLRGTTTDYMALGLAADLTAKRVAATSTLSSSDALAAAGALSRSAGYVPNTLAQAITKEGKAQGIAATDEGDRLRITAPDGTSEAEVDRLVARVRNVRTLGTDLSNLTRLSADLAAVMGTTVVEAANKLADAMAHPAAAARKLADENNAFVSQGLAIQIEALERSGKRLEAVTLLTAAYQKSVGGAAEAGTELQKALNALSKEFFAVGDSGKSAENSLSSILGRQVLNPVVSSIKAVTDGLVAMRGAIDALKEGNVIEAIKIIAGTTGATASPSGDAGFAGPILLNIPKLLNDYLGTNLPVRQNAPSSTPIDRDTGQATRPSTQLDDAVMKQIYAIAEREGVTGRIADLATRVAYQESRGRQFNADGSVYTNASSGALGIGQLLPGTAAEVNADPTTVAGNITGMIRYLNKLSQTFASDADIAGAYNAGPGRYGKYLKGIGAPLRQETIDYVRNVGGQVIVPQRAGSVTGTVQYGPPRAQDDISFFDNDQRQTINAARKNAEDTTSSTQQRLKQEIEGNVESLRLLASEGITTGASVDALKEKQGLLRGQLVNTRTAYEEQIHSLDLAAQATGRATGAERAHNDALIAAREAAIKSGQGQLTADQINEVSIKVQETLNGKYAENVLTQERGIEQQQRLNDSYAAGSKSVAEYTNRIAAENEASNTAQINTKEYREQVEELTAVKNRASAVSADQKTLGLGIERDQELALLKAETGLVGLSADARERELAAIKERARITKDGGDPNSDISKRAVASVANIAAQTAANKQLENSYNDLANVGVNAFSQVGDAIVSAFAQGTLKTLNFGDIFRGVIASVVKQLATLAVINPILNSLFGGTRSTLGSGLEAFFGSSGSSGALSVAKEASAVIKGSDGGSGQTTASDGSALGQAVSGGSSSSGGLGVVGGLKVAYDLGKLAFNGVGSAAETAFSSITSLLGSTSQAISSATNVALTAAGEGVYGVATAGQVATATVAEAAGLSSSAAASAVSAATTIGQAVPYIGAAISIATSLAKGDYKSAAVTAGFVATGALIGSIIPGIGTAVGAAVGLVVATVVNAFTTPHPKNPFEAIDLNASGGQLSRGKVVSQLIDPTADTAAVDVFAVGVNDFMQRVGIKLSNADGRLGIVGQGADPKKNNYTANVLDLFKTLRFTDSTNDGSNFAVAKAGGLQGREFENVEALQSALVKIGSFSDGLDLLGLQLKSLATGDGDLRNIKIDGLKASVLAQGNLSALQTAFQTRLAGITFPNLEEFQAEISRINNFVNGTYPSLLDPQITTTTQLQKSIQDLVVTYANAIAQAKSYGLATDGLVTAQAKGIALLQAPALKALAVSNAAIVTRGLVASGAETTADRLKTFDMQADQQRDALVAQFKDIYGSLIPPAKEYGIAAKALDKTLAAERLALQKQSDAALLAAAKQAAEAQQDASLGLYAKFISIRDRGEVSRNGGKATLNSDLNELNLKQIDEVKAYSRSLLAYYGDSFAASKDYQDRMKELDAVYATDRINLTKQYKAQEVAVLTQAHNQIASTISSLSQYATGLQTSNLSPLSPQVQLALAKRQFQAVGGAAAAGDYTSTTKLQGYADTFLTASRAVNGSGAAYVADFNKVLDVLGSVGAVKVDTLTASYQKSIVDAQTDTLVAELRKLRAEVAALRLETKQAAATPARAA